MIVPPLRVITLLAPLVASSCFTVTVPPVTSSVPDPERPMSIWPLVTVRLPPLMLTTLFEAPANALMTKLVPTNTSPPLEMTRLLLLPVLPTIMLLAKLCVPPLAMKVAPLPVSPILKSDPLFTVVPAEMIVPPLKLITLLVPLVASNCFTVTVPPVTLSVPEPALPMSIWPLVTVRLPPLMLATLFEAPTDSLMTKSVPTNTPPPSAMVRLLPLPMRPTWRRSLLVHVPPSVTSTLLLEEVVSKPMKPKVATTVPPLEMTRLLLLPPEPTATYTLLVQSEPAPVTSTLLLEEREEEPMTPGLFATVPPLEMIRLLPLLPVPT